MKPTIECAHDFIQRPRNLLAHTFLFGDFRRMASERRIEARRGFRDCIFAGGAPEIAAPAM